MFNQDFCKYKHALRDSLKGAVLLGCVGLFFTLSPAITSSVLLLSVFFMLSKWRNKLTAMVVTLIPLFVNIVDSLPGNQTDFRHLMFSVYSIALLVVVVRNRSEDV